MNIVNTEQTKLPTINKSNIGFKKIIKILKKLVIFLGVILLALVLFLLFLYFTKFDRNIFKTSVNGVVKDVASDLPIKDAIVRFNSIEVKTNEQGQFNLSGYLSDQEELSITSTNYKPISQSIDLNRSFLTFTFTADFKLEPLNSGILTGNITTNQNHNFIGDVLRINNQEVKVENDGTFLVTNLPKGEYKFEYTSLEYKDIVKTIEIKEGANKLETINPEPAGDLIGVFKDWLNENSPIKANIQADNVLANQISILDNGNFVIKDLPVGREFLIRITHPNYLSRDYKLITTQGENQIFDLRMIPNDIIATYVKRRSNSPQIFGSDLDGSNAKILTNIERLDPEFYSHKSDSIYFVSDHEKIQGLNSRTLSLGYRLDLKNEKVARLSTSFTGLSSPKYHKDSNKITNIATFRSGQITTTRLELRDISGSNSVTITSQENITILDSRILKESDNVYFLIKKGSESINSLYFYSQELNSSELLLSEEGLAIKDIAKDAKTLLLTRKNSTTKFEDLITYDFVNKSTRILLQTHDGFNYTFDEGVDTLFYFYAKRDGRSNIFKYNLENNQTTRVTFLKVEDSVSNFYIVNRYLFYRVSTKLYVLDKNLPLNYKLVTENILEI